MQHGTHSTLRAVPDRLDTPAVPAVGRRAVPGGAAEIGTGARRSGAGSDVAPELAVRIARMLRRPVLRVLRAGPRPDPSVVPLDVLLADGGTLRLVHKDLALEARRAGVPAFLNDPVREIEIYQRVLALDPISVPTLHGSWVDERAGEYMMLLERIDGAPLAEVGGFPLWRRVMAWLAEMHGHFETQTGTLVRNAGLRVHDAGYFRLWMRRARAFGTGAGRRPAREARTVLTWLASRHERLIEEILALPTTLVHGRFGADHVIINRTGALRLSAVGWQLAAVGTGLFDVATLTEPRSGRERAALARTYHAALPPGPAAALPYSDLVRGVECCRLQLAIQWLGWSRGPRPPSARRRDRLAEAERLARRLAL